MQKIQNIETTRNMNGGDWVCRVCGYANKAKWVTVAHASGHVGKAFLNILGIVMLFV